VPAPSSAPQADRFAARCRTGVFAERQGHEEAGAAGRAVELDGAVVLADEGLGQREAEPVPGAPDEPVAAVEALAEALREGDLKRYAELSLPPAMHAQQKALWRQQVAAKNPVDAEQAQRYAELMAQLTAPDAETALWAKAEPKLVALEQELGPKWTLGVTMLSGFDTTAISASLSATRGKAVSGSPNCLRPSA
jgi:hypothetical protein